MPSKIGIGISTKLDSYQAGKESAIESYLHLKDSPDILFVFISPIFNPHDVIRAIRSLRKAPFIVACSAVASITNKGVYPDSVTCVGISSSEITFSISISPSVQKNTRLAGRVCAEGFTHKTLSHRQLLMLFTNPVFCNMSELLRGVQEILGTGFPVRGGGVSSNLRFSDSFQFINSDVYIDAAIGILLSGEINISSGVGQGWLPVGRPHSITKYLSNKIIEIDGKPALSLYKEYLDIDTDNLRKEGIGKYGCLYPLGARVGETNIYLTRTPMLSENDYSMVLNADFPEYKKDMNIMMGDRVSIIEETKKACKDVKKTIGKKEIEFGLVFSDISRYQVLRRDINKEVMALKEVLGKEVPFFGCYTCGEYAPLNIGGLSGESYFHNQSISITLVSR